MSFKKIERDGLSNAIDKLLKSGGKLDQDTHNVVVSALYDAKEGNMDHVSKMISALGKSQSKTQLLIYIKAHAPLKWSKKAAQFKLKKPKNQNPWKLAYAENTPFWDWEAPKKDKEPFNARRVITKLRKQVEEAIANGEYNQQERETLRAGLAAVIVDYTETSANTTPEQVAA